MQHGHQGGPHFPALTSLVGTRTKEAMAYLAINKNGRRLSHWFKLKNDAADWRYKMSLELHGEFAGDTCRDVLPYEVPR